MSEKNPVNIWSITGINLLAWPGLGTLLAGRKLSGFIQTAMSLVGAILTICLLFVLFNFASIGIESSKPIDSKLFIEQKNSLIEVLNNFGENLKQQICTNAIGKIIEYDPVKKVAKVQLLNKQKKKDGAVSVLPMLERVPVLTSHSTNYIIATDLKDELCLVLFCDHSIEDWQVTEGKEPFTPVSSRRHNINDAICIIGLFAEKTQSKVTLAPKKENFDVLFADDKKLRIGNSNVELVKDVLNVIEAEYPYDGIVYLCSNENITLGEVADLADKKIEFGDYWRKHPSIFTDYNTDRTSKDNVTKFIEEMK